ncbi:histidine kinase [Dinghuibacter silviterrae]|uniref:Histidine kinase n=1 Tax=Dinghuibacter silviterrae TaxID=1539049 RepID=A0A4V3GKN7_9BACT|nr:histidine kinase [Dinghuibacter silviterrae]
MILATLVLALLLATYALSFVAVFKLGRGAGVQSAIIVGVRTTIIGMINIGVFLFCQRYVRWSERKKRTLRYLATAVLSFCLSILTDWVFFTWTSRGSTGNWHFYHEFPSIVLQASLNYMMVAAAHEVTILDYEKSKTLLENAELKAASMESAYQLLRQQTHPHFLFNALSMLKSLYKRDVPAGEAYLAHLVNFLRASLTNSQQKVSTVMDEIKLCNDYIVMQKIRFGNALHCDIQVPDEVMQTGAVPSFALQLLLENAIKHNEITAYAPLLIKVYYKDGWIVTENSIRPKAYIDVPSRKGLANLEERYRLISDERVLVGRENGLFSVSIKVLSYEDYHHRG